MKACDADIIAIDFETTGQVRGQLDMPWQIGMACLHSSILLPDVRFSAYLRVPIEYHFNQYAPGRWAELRETLAESPSLLEEWQEISPWLSDRILLAHNVPTERKILKQTFPMHAFGPWIDTLRIARQAYPGLESYALSDLLDTLALRQSVNAICKGLAPHDACFDAVACARLFQHILTLPGWSDATIEYLSTV